MEEIWTRSWVARRVAERGRQVLDRGEFLVLSTALAALLLSVLLARIVVRELAAFTRGGTCREARAGCLAARDDLLAIIAHDLRSPLSAIR